MYKSIFPTFDEIEKGYQVFSEDFYKGQDEYGDPIWGERLNLKLVIAHNALYPLMSDIIIVRNRKKERTGFKITIAGIKFPRIFSYTEKGWGDCIQEIKKQMIQIRKATEKVLNEKL